MIKVEYKKNLFSKLLGVESEIEGTFGEINMAKKVTKDKPLLTAKELDTLRWVQEGKTNDEIGVIMNKTKWTVKFHLSNVMRKLDVTSRTQAVSQAIGLGLLVPTEPEGLEVDIVKTKVGIIGGGKGGVALLEVFRENQAIEVAWLADKDPSSKGYRAASEENINVETDYKKALKIDVDMVVNVTGSRALTSEIVKVSPGVEVMDGLAARLMWQLVEERRRRVQEREKTLKQHEALYHMGLVIENIDSLKDAGFAIVDYAIKLTGASAGAIALFDDTIGDMKMLASKGFSEAFKSKDSWEIRKGGFTSNILNNDTATFIEDLRLIPDTNPVLIKEGIRSVLASPLVVERKIVGIIYVGDFKKRKFRADDTSIFSLLSIYGALTIERVKSIEEMHLMSITDGLTGLYNHRYIMEQLQKELVRVSRHSRTLSVIMLDVDHFKKYNDSYGHLEGNKALRALASHLTKCARVTDTVGRFGGEEFCIVLPEIDREGAELFATRMQEKLKAVKMPNTKVTLSGGIATFPEDGSDFHKLLKKADARLYQAKQDGRDCMVSSD